jgi:hypothetical protein
MNVSNPHHDRTRGATDACRTIGAAELRTLLLSRKHLEWLPPRDGSRGVVDCLTGSEYRTNEAGWARLIEQA